MSSPNRSRSQFSLLKNTSSYPNSSSTTTITTSTPSATLQEDHQKQQQHLIKKPPLSSSVTTPIASTTAAASSSSSSSTSRKSSAQPRTPPSAPASSSTATSPFGFSAKLFKKCKSATFQIDGATYTIGTGGRPGPNQVRVPGCFALPCSVGSGTTINAQVDFTASAGALSLSPDVWITAGGNHINYQLPQGQLNACNHLAVGACPLGIGASATYNFAFFASGAITGAVTIEVSLLNQAAATVFCGIIDVFVS